MRSVAKISLLALGVIFFRGTVLAQTLHQKGNPLPKKIANYFSYDDPVFYITLTLEPHLVMAR